MSTDVCGYYFVLSSTVENVYSNRHLDWLEMENLSCNRSKTFEATFVDIHSFGIDRSCIDRDHEMPIITGYKSLWTEWMALLLLL